MAMTETGTRPGWSLKTHAWFAGRNIVAYSFCKGRKDVSENSHNASQLPTMQAAVKQF